MSVRTFFTPLSLLSVGALVVLSSAQGCSDDFGQSRSQAHLVVTIEQGERGSFDAPIPISFDTPKPYVVKVTAIKADGTLDTDFNGWVRLSSKPGTLLLGSGDDKSTRNAQLTNGTADGVAVSLLAAYGNTRLWAEDLGFIPGDPKSTPQCADGIDNNGNGAVDFPADDGCAFPNDDSEDGGSYAGGVSDVLYYVAPRIADVRGVVQGGGATSFPQEQVQIDTGWRNANNYAFSAVVTRVSSDGFYVTDLGDADTAHGGRGYASVFAFNFSAPPNMQICDRIKTFGGTTSDFFGFTEVNYPTWTLEEWVPKERLCMVPEPTVLGVDALATDVSTQPLLEAEASLVRVETVHTPTKNVDVHVSSKFGPDLPAMSTKADGSLSFDFTATATNCDLNRDGKADVNTDPEKTCVNYCGSDFECTEFSNYKARNAFRLVVVDKSSGGGIVRAILADASSSAQFDPVLARGQTIRAFTGTLRYFSGGSQFTIEARCIDDIIVDLNAPPHTSDFACVNRRTTVDVNAGSN